MPTDLPEKIEIDISPLKEVNQEIKVKDLSLPKGIALSEDLNANSLVVKIGPLEEEVAEVAPAPAPEAAAETAEEPAEGQKEKEADSTSKEKEGETIKDKTQGEAPSKEKPQQK